LTWRFTLPLGRENWQRGSDESQVTTIKQGGNAIEIDQAVQGGKIAQVAPAAAIGAARIASDAPSA
jgi:hypothetical protein